MIKVGGYSVYAVEVEAALARHPAVAEAAVLALADDRLGEVPGRGRPPGARRGGSRRLTPRAAGRGRCRPGPYKRPRRLVVVDELPRTGTARFRRTASGRLRLNVAHLSSAEIEGQRPVVVDEDDDPLGVGQLLRA